MSVRPSPRASRRTSALLRQIIADEREIIGAGEVLERLGDKGWGLLVLLFAAASAVPIPGMSTLAGLPILLIALHLLTGSRGESLFQPIATREIGLAKLRHILSRDAVLLEGVEKYTRLRPGHVIGRKCDTRIAAASILLASILLMLPVPLSNLPLGIAIAMLAMAIIERDRILTILAWVSAALAVAFFAVLVKGYILLIQGIAIELV